MIGFWTIGGEDTSTVRSNKSTNGSAISKEEAEKLEEAAGWKRDKTGRESAGEPRVGE